MGFQNREELKIKRIKIAILMAVLFFTINAAFAGILNIIGTGINLVSNTIDVTKKTNDVVSSFSGDAAAQTGKTSKNKEHFSLEYLNSCNVIQHMMLAYHENSVRAAEKWLNKELTLTLRVNSISKKENGYLILGACPEAWNEFVLKIPCSKDQTMSTKLGDYIVVKGKVTNYDSNCVCAILIDGEIIKV